jgi:2-amino-4-hydroxy-6-hydroxymethyldihydropteridine diphosphokinase
MNYFLSLGSNLGYRKRNMRRAIALLESSGAKILARSSLYQTQPIGYNDQPWFINQVIEVESGLSPWELLGLLQSIEKKMGRTKTHPNGPRLIDLDILLAEETILETEALTIPHPRLAQRNFVLAPLTEIAPNVIHPALQRSIAALHRAAGDRSLVHKLKKSSKKDLSESPHNR